MADQPLSDQLDSAARDAAFANSQFWPQPGSTWKHFKGGEYEVICCAVKEDTLEVVVVYRSAKDKRRNMIRTLANWCEHVTSLKNPTQQIPRFVELGHST